MAQPNTRIEPYAKRLAAAVYFWKNLQERQVHPDGSFDKSGRFYPSEEERESCCDSIRSPSRSFPYSYMTHCRSMGHVAQKFGIALGDMRKECHACATMSARTYKSKRMGKKSGRKTVVTTHGAFTTADASEKMIRLMLAPYERHVSTHVSRTGKKIK